MRVSKVKEFLKSLYPKRSVILLGAAGIGKTETVRRTAEEIAKEQGKEFVEYTDKVAQKLLENPEDYFVFHDLRLTEIEPSDLIGIPRNSEDSEFVRYKPLIWAEVMFRCAGILFLDEITNVQRMDIIAAAYKLMYDKSAGYIKFNDNVMIVAAGNSPEHSSIANYLPAPLINRCYVINVEPPTVEEWIEYMNKNHDEWDKRVGAYLSLFKNELITKPDSTETLEPFATPRQWTALAEDIIGIDDQDTIYEYAASTVGKSIAPKFATFATKPIPKLEELLKNPALIKTLDTEQQYLSASIVAANITKAVNVIEWMATNHRELAVVTTMLANTEDLMKTINKAPKLTELLTHTIKITSDI